MSDTVLRGRLIRLAAARPDLRADLLPLLTDKAASRPIHQIAREIRSDWKPVNFGAKPYLEAMMSMDTIDDMYGADDGHMIVRYFLTNAKTWKGDVAKRVKAELNQMLKGSKVACGWDGGESDTMGCGEGTVMAKHEKGVSVDPTEDMSPEDAKKWEKQKVINQDKFTKGAATGRTAGCHVDTDSIRRTYGPGVYDTWLLTSRARNGKKPQMAAQQVLRQYGPQLSQMTAGDAVTFVDQKVLEMTGKVPDWHYYSMPD